jgi:putative DNA primase/helicase
VKVTEVPVAMPGVAPAWVYEAYDAAAKADKKTSFKLPDVVEDGTRNNTAASFAGVLRYAGASPVAILAALRSENSSGRFKPALDDHELQAIAKQSAKWKQGDTFAARTDKGNGERLVIQHGEDLRYVSEQKRWYVWDGTRWAKDRLEEIYRRAKLTAVAIGDEAKLEEDEDERKAVFKWAMQSQNMTKLDAMIKAARSETKVRAVPEIFDTDPWKLNVLNGTIDLKTGKLQPHRREDLITRIIPVAWDDTAECPTWLKFLDRIFAGNADMPPYMQRVTGYTLTGKTHEHKLFFLWGSGRNGKTTFVETVAAVLGDYAQAADFETFAEKKFSDHGPRPDIARMPGVRLVHTSETEEGRKLAESAIKSLTGGDTVATRGLYESFFDFHPSFKLFIRGNYKPRISGPDEGIWSRISLIHLAVRIPDDEQDHDLGEKLLKELPGILRWAVEGCLEWQKRGLAEPQSVVQDTAAYRKAEDVLADFLDDCCETGSAFEVAAADAYAAYTEWAAEAGEKHPFSRTMFGRKLTDRYTKVPRRDASYYLGLKLRKPPVAGQRPKF